MNQFGGSWPANHLGWKGCVFNDDSVKDLNSTLRYREPGAWDIDRSLPGEGGHPPVSPYFIPPMYVPELASESATAAEMAKENGSYYKVAGVEPNNNLYRLDATWANAMLDPSQYGVACACWRATAAASPWLNLPTSCPRC